MWSQDKCRGWEICFYVIVNLISVIACEFAFASRKTMNYMR
ncbi:MAG: hypothetical protein ACLT33_10900 [Lachnospira pectinoschiza]